MKNFVLIRVEGGLLHEVVPTNPQGLRVLGGGDDQHSEEENLVGQHHVSALTRTDLRGRSAKTRATGRSP